MAYERKVATFTLKVWRGPGLTSEELADQLEHAAQLVRDGCYAGEVIACHHDGGWWDTAEMEVPTPRARTRKLGISRAAVGG